LSLTKIIVADGNHCHQQLALNNNSQCTLTTAGV
jgi:hypothetical protein